MTCTKMQYRGDSQPKLVQGCGAALCHAKLEGSPTQPSRACSFLHLSRLVSPCFFELSWRSKNQLLVGALRTLPAALSPNSSRVSFHVHDSAAWTQRTEPCTLARNEPLSRWPTGMVSARFLGPAEPHSSLLERARPMQSLNSCMPIIFERVTSEHVGKERTR